MNIDTQKAVAMALAVVLTVVVIIMVTRKLGSSGFSSAPPSNPVVVSGPKSLYDRLGGAFSIAAVVDRFSDSLLRSRVVGVNSPNPALRAWSRKQVASRMPGLKFMRTLWVADVAGGPQKYSGTKPGVTRLDLSNAHRHLHISSEEFDEVARILSETLDHFHVPAVEKGEVLKAFAAHKKEVVDGSISMQRGSQIVPASQMMRCPFS